MSHKTATFASYCDNDPVPRHYYSRPSHASFSGKNYLPMHRSYVTTMPSSEYGLHKGSSSPEYRRSVSPEYRRSVSPDYHSVSQGTRSPSPENRSISTRYYRSPSPKYRTIQPEHPRHAGHLRQPGQPEYRIASPEYTIAPPKYRMAPPEYRMAPPEYRMTSPKYRMAPSEYPRVGNYVKASDYHRIPQTTYITSRPTAEHYPVRSNYRQEYFKTPTPFSETVKFPMLENIRATETYTHSLEDARRQSHLESLYSLCESDKGITNYTLIGKPLKERPDLCDLVRVLSKENLEENLKEEKKEEKKEVPQETSAEDILLFESLLNELTQDTESVLSKNSNHLSKLLTQVEEVVLSTLKKTANETEEKNEIEAAYHQKQRDRSEIEFRDLIQNQFRMKREVMVEKVVQVEEIPKIAKVLSKELEEKISSQVQKSLKNQLQHSLTEEMTKLEIKLHELNKPVPGGYVEAFQRRQPKQPKPPGQKKKVPVMISSRMTDTEKEKARQSAKTRAQKTLKQ